MIGFVSKGAIALPIGMGPTLVNARILHSLASIATEVRLFTLAAFKLQTYDEWLEEWRIRAPCFTTCGFCLTVESLFFRF